MTTEYNGKLNGEGKKIVIIISRFNEFITSKLLGGAKDALIRHGVSEKDIDVVWCPGAFEIPAVLNRVVKYTKTDGVICLGAVIRGATPHFEYVSSEVSKGIASIAIAAEVAVSFGVITTDNLEQAIERAGSKSGNKGWDAAMSVLEMSDLYSQIS